MNPRDQVTLNNMEVKWRTVVGGQNQAEIATLLHQHYFFSTSLSAISQYFWIQSDGF